MDIKVISKYMTHLPTCNKMQNWDEAYDAFANTPEKFRDHEYDLALQELDAKRNTCTCGLNTVMLHLEHQPFIESPSGSEAWVSVEDRLPTPQDADDKGYVMVFLRPNKQWGWPTRKGFTLWKRIEKSRHSHWMTIIDPIEPEPK